MILGELHLRPVLVAYADYYYNGFRTHRALAKSATR